MISHRDTVTGHVFADLNGEGEGGGRRIIVRLNVHPPPDSTSDTRVHRKLACMTS